MVIDAHAVCLNFEESLSVGHGHLLYAFAGIQCVQVLIGEDPEQSQFILVSFSAAYRVTKALIIFDKQRIDFCAQGLELHILKKLLPTRVLENFVNLDLGLVLQIE